MKILFSESKAVLGRVTEGKKGILGRAGSNMDMLKPLTGSLMVLSPSKDKPFTQSFADFGATSSLSGDQSNKPRYVSIYQLAMCIHMCLNRFDQVFSSLLEQLQPVCVSEQKFLTSFFHFAKPTVNEIIVEEEEPEDDIDAIESVLREDSMLSGVHSILAQLLGILLQEIEAFIAHGDRIDN